MLSAEVVTHFCFSENRHKVNITHNANGTVTYAEIKTFNFVRSMSVGDDSENFTTLNIPLLVGTLLLFP